MDKLLDPNRIVTIERTLRFPNNLTTWESVPYWLALAIVSELPVENVKSLRIKEIE